jgi:hypothetical protein
MRDSLLEILYKTEVTSIDDLITAIMQYPLEITKLAINSMDRAKATELLTDDFVSKLLDINVIPSFINSPNAILSEHILIRLLTAAPELITNINTTLITERCARLIIESEPELFDELPSHFQTFEMALLIHPEIQNYINVPKEIIKKMTANWMDGSQVWMHECKKLEPPKTPGELFDFLSKTKASGHLSTAYSSFSNVIFHALPFFEPSDAWISAKNKENEAIVEKVFGRKTLINSTKISSQQKKTWIADDLGI